MKINYHEKMKYELYTRRVQRSYSKQIQNEFENDILAQQISFLMVSEKYIGSTYYVLCYVLYVVRDIKLPILECMDIINMFSFDFVKF